MKAGGGSKEGKKNFQFNWIFTTFDSFLAAGR
jgi:hypothetical protein